MQQVQFETSMKNIPLGGKKEYVMQLTKSVRKVVYAMSWAALSIVICIFFLPSVADDPFGETDCSTME